MKQNYGFSDFFFSFLKKSSTASTVVLITQFESPRPHLYNYGGYTESNSRKAGRNGENHDITRIKNRHAF